MPSHADRRDRHPVTDLTPFIGRREELDKLAALLADPDVRLVTLLGPGGIGKTRLAQELSTAVQGKFQDGISFLSLAQLSRGDHLLPALAAGLDLRPEPEVDLQQAVLDGLRSRQLLLVLDNFEHLLEEALLIRDILIAADRVKVLVTSREKLNLQGEVLYPLHGLQLPPQQQTQKIETYDAVCLFLQRARQAQPGFVLSEQDLAAVVQICRLVEGMPLGILLAAAWMEHFSPQAILSRIARDLDFLSSELRDIPERHRSLRLVFDSSFEYLDPKQQTVFLRLAVFQGGFDAEAAEAVTGADLRALLWLVEKSLLQREIHAGRFDLHELLRQFAAEKLTKTGESEKIEALHTAYYLRLAHQLAPRLKSISQAEALDAIQADLENVSRAWDWALEHGKVEALAGAAPSLYAFFDMRSRYDEGRVLFEGAVQHLSLSSTKIPCFPHALILLSWYDFLPDAEKPNFSAELTAKAEDCLRQAQAEQNAAATACSLILLGAIAGDRRDLKTAISRYHEAMQLYPPLDDFYWVNMRVGLCYQALGEYAAALRSFQESLARGQAAGERAKMGWSLCNLGETLAMAGKSMEAKASLQQALGMFEELGTSGGTLTALYDLSNLARLDGSLEEGRSLANRALEIAQQKHAASWIEKISALLEQMQSGNPKPAALAEALSERELEVLDLLKSDLDGPEMAGRLFVTLNTIRYHTKNIYRKLQVKSRREAVRRAKELGL